MAYNNIGYGAAIEESKMNWHTAKLLIAGGTVLSMSAMLPAIADFGDPGDQSMSGCASNQPGDQGGCMSSQTDSPLIGPSGCIGVSDNADHYAQKFQSRPQTNVQTNSAEFRRQAQAMQDEQDELYMQQQMQQVATYMAHWCMRNSRFPEQSGEWQQKWDVERQLDMLVPNNPYALGTTMQACGMPQVASYNANGSPATGAPAAYPFENQQAQMYSQSNQRVHLYTDQSLTPDMIDYYEENPPEDWRAAPGSIICIGSPNGYIMVWGAGRDGKPLKNVLNGQTLIVSSSWALNEQDMNSPNEDQ